MKVCTPFCDQQAHARIPFHRARDLPEERVAGAEIIGYEFRIHVAGDRIDRLLQLERIQIGFQAVLRGLHQRTMKGRADRQQFRPLGAALVGELAWRVLRRRCVPRSRFVLVN